MSGYAQKYGCLTAIAVLFALLAALTFKSIRDDLWIHVKVGEEIVANGGIPARDDLSYTRHNDERSISHLWLASILFYYLDRWVGLLGLRIFLPIMVFCFSLSIFYFYRTIGFSLWECTLATCLVWAISVDRFRLRPHLFTLCSLYLLLAFFLKRRPYFRLKDIGLLYLFTALAINLHSEAIVFTLLVTAFTGAELVRSRQITSSLKWLVAATIAVWLAALSTPYPIERLSYILRAKPLEQYVGEYQLTLVYWKYPDRMLLVMASLLVAVIFARAIIKKEASLGQLAIGFPLLYLGLRYARCIYMLGIPLAFGLTGAREKLRSNRLLPLVQTVVLVFLISYITLLRFPDFFHSITHPEQHADPAYFPVEATRFLKNYGIHGRIFAGEKSVTQWNTYLLYYLYPLCRTFMDTRHIYGREQLLREFYAIYHGTPYQEWLLEQYQVQILVVDRGFRFAVNGNIRWMLIYQDSNVSIWRRL